MNKLNLKFINIEKEDTAKNYYFETSNSASPTYIKYTSFKTLAGTTGTPGDDSVVIPYNSIVFIKDVQLTWTHGLIYLGTDKDTTYTVSGSTQTFVIDGTTYTLALSGNSFLINKETPATFTITATADVTSTTDTTYYDDTAHSATATVTPQNKVTVSIASTGTHSGVSISKVQFSTNNSTWGDATLSNTSTDSNSKVISVTATVSSGTTGYASAASNTSSVALSASKLSVSSGAATTLYVRVIYTLDNSTTEVTSAVTTISHPAVKSYVTYKNKVYYRTSTTSSWTEKETAYNAKTFSFDCPASAYVQFAYPNGWGTSWKVLYGGGSYNETSMFKVMESTPTITGKPSLTYIYVERAAMTDAAVTYIVQL